MEQLINKVLGMDFDTRRRTIEGAVLYIFTAFATCNLFTLNEQWQDIIAKLAVLAVEAFILFYEEHYKNNDHTEIAAEHTGEMRQEKLEQNPDYVGERFYTEELGAPDIDLDGDFDNVLEEENLEEIEDDIEVEEEVKENE